LPRAVIRILLATDLFVFTLGMACTFRTGSTSKDAVF
jgi:hypothetical protein